MGTENDSLSLQFARFGEATRYDRTSSEVVEAVKLYVLDWFGNCIGGAQAESSRCILAAAQELNGRSDSTVLGVGSKMEPSLAALVNGTMSHALEMDDDHRTMCGHPGVVVTPAALALSEREGLSGKELIEAVLVGYEMAIRLGTCFQGKAYYEGWHPTSICGGFGATAAAAKALKLDEPRFAAALGLAGSMAGGTRGWEESFAKRFHAGNACRNGVLAAVMAKNGFTGPVKVFESVHGFFNTHCRKAAASNDRGEPVVQRLYDADILCNRLGSEYLLMDNSFKVHSGGRFGASSIDACLDIVKKHDVKPEQVKEIRIGACDFTIQAHFKEGCYRPRGVVAAQFSLPFAMAMAVLNQRVSVTHFTEETFRDPKVIELMDKVKKYVDPEAEKAYPDHYVATVTIVLHDGRSLQSHVDYPKGDPENRPTKEELYDKFRDLAGLSLAPKKVEDLLDHLVHLEKVTDMRAITKMAGR